MGWVVRVCCMLVGIAGFPVALVGCSSGAAGGDVVPAVRQAIFQQMNQQPSTVTCPANFTGQVGTVTDCTVTFSGTPEHLDYRVQVLSVENGVFRVKVLQNGCVADCPGGIGGAGGIPSLYRVGPVTKCAKTPDGDPMASGTFTNLSSGTLVLGVAVSFTSDGAQFATGNASQSVSPGKTASYTTSMPDVYARIPSSFSCTITSSSYMRAAAGNGL